MSIYVTAHFGNQPLCQVLLFNHVLLRLMDQIIKNNQSNDKNTCTICPFVPNEGHSSPRVAQRENILVICFFAFMYLC